MRLSSFQMEAVERSLDGYALRAQALATNIANVNTPDYVTQDVDFEETLREAMTEASKPQPLHGTEITEHNVLPLLHWQPTMQASQAGPQRLDGNGTAIEFQMGQVADNAIRFNAIARAIASELQLLKHISTAK